MDAWVLNNDIVSLRCRLLDIAIVVEDHMSDGHRVVLLKLGVGARVDLTGQSQRVSDAVVLYGLRGLVPASEVFETWGREGECLFAP